MCRRANRLFSMPGQWECSILHSKMFTVNTALSNTG
jgi:hypothetical protein